MSRFCAAKCSSPDTYVTAPLMRMPFGTSACWNTGTAHRFFRLPMSSSSLVTNSCSHRTAIAPQPMCGAYKHHAHLPSIPRAAFKEKVIMPAPHFSKIWLQQQRRQRAELLSARADADGALINRALDRYESYYSARAHAARTDPVWFLTAPWATPLERAVHWVAGWRPNTLIHLFYSESGLRFEAQLGDLLRGVHSGDLGDLKSDQLRRIDELQRRTVKDEKEIGEEMGKLQEGFADPFLPGDSDIEAKLGRLQEVIRRADELRMRTLREVVGILAPVQAVDLLVAAADLEIGIRELGLEQSQRCRDNKI